MSEYVVVISCSEDGDHHIERMPKQQFLDKLNDQWWGENPTFTDSVDLSDDLNEFEGLIVIDGDIVRPGTQEVVKKYTLG